MRTTPKVDSNPVNRYAPHQAFADRFVQDDRVAAACLIGSYAKRKADQYSDIDLMVITTDSAFKEFYQQRGSFLRSLWFSHYHLTKQGTVMLPKGHRFGTV